MILLLGATGCLGTQVLRRLLTKRLPVRIIARGQVDWQSPLADRFKAQGVEVRYADFLQPDKLADAITGCDAVINTIGSMNFKDLDNLHEANFQIAKNLIEVTDQCGVQRFIQIGCLGASEKSKSAYLQSKWQADKLVQESKCDWTILRPSFMFGEKFQVKELLAPVVRFPAFLPVFGSGVNLVQPVSVENVAECILMSLYDRTTVRQTFELAGPELLTMSKFLEMLRENAGRAGGIINIPLDVTRNTASFLTKGLPKQFFNTELLELLTGDSASSRNDLKDKFGIDGATLSSYVTSS
jgi:NADH dehydrogenase